MDRVDTTDDSRELVVVFSKAQCPPLLLFLNFLLEIIIIHRKLKGNAQGIPTPSLPSVNILLIRI